MTPSKPTLYLVSNAHLDTCWIWDIRTVIDHYLPATTRDNFALFEEFPHYTFNFEGSFRYRLIKEYYPDDWRRLKQYVQQGRWAVCGSSVDAGDVNVPAAESIIRHVLYGNGFFRKELGVESTDIFLPDCFGFGYALPSIAAHCGLKGFSTQKLTWGVWTEVPFELGRWTGPDGESIVAALKAGDYTWKVGPGFESDPNLLRSIDENRSTCGVPVALRYFGTGDKGGSPGAYSCANIEAAINAGGACAVRMVKADQLFIELTPQQVAAMPGYQGELLMTAHGAGCYTAHAALKRLNRANERIAHAAERAAVMAHWLGYVPYPHATLTDAWTGVLWHQFHDDLTGTGLPATYLHSWNELGVSWNRFASVLTDGVAGVARTLDLATTGTPVVLSNPLAFDRQEVAEVSLHCPGEIPPRHVRVFGPDGAETPSQVAHRCDDGVTVLFLAKVPATGMAVYDVRTSEQPCCMTTELRATDRCIENQHYRVTLDENGDIASIVDKATETELLRAPVGLEIRPNQSHQWPAWEILHDAVSAPARSRFGAPADIAIVENGPVRVSLEVKRWCEGSVLVQRISLDCAPWARRVDVLTDVDWHSHDALLKAAFPLVADNTHATYDLGIGVIERGVNTPKLYEVPVQRWVDLTDASGTFGVSLMSDCKYGWDRPDTHTMRLTLLHTPASTHPEFFMQDQLDFGRHRFRYAIHGHAADGRVWQQAAAFDQPLVAVQMSRREGGIGREFHGLRISHPDVELMALKLAESGDRWIVRMTDKSGRGCQGVNVVFPGSIRSAEEADGQERPLGRSVPASDNIITLDFTPFQTRTLSVAVATPASRGAPPAVHRPWALHLLNYQATSRDGTAAQGAGYDRGAFIPAECLGDHVVDGVAIYRRWSVGLGSPDVISCRGQKLTFSDVKPGAALWMLAAARDADTRGRFFVNNAPVDMAIQCGGGFVAQWDRRAHPAYPNSNIPGGYSARVEPCQAFHRDARIAWVSSHRHDSAGRNISYDFCYAYSYRIALPTGTVEIRFPDNADILVHTYSIVEDGWGETPRLSVEHPLALRVFEKA